MHRTSILSFLRYYLFLAVLSAVTFGCGGRSDDGSLPGTGADAGALDASKLGDGSALQDGGAHSDSSVSASDAGDATIDGRTADGALDARADAAGTVLVSIAITPPASTIAVGTRVTLAVTGTYSDKTTADVTPNAKFSADSMAVTFLGNAAIGQAAGTATITATVNGLTATAKVTVSKATVTSIEVTPPSATTGVGGAIDFAAVATLSDGSHQDVSTSVIWSSSSTSVASVDTTGHVQGLAPGDTTIRADLNGISGTAAFHVNAAKLLSIAIDPALPVVGTGVTLSFTATARYSDGSISDVTAAVAWSSSDTTVLDISAVGLGTAQAPGTSIVTATLTGITGTTTVTVTPATLLSIDVAPATLTLAVMGTAPLKATGHYSDMTMVDLTETATWTSDTPGVAFVSNASGANGVVTAVGGGGATITATFGGVSGTAKVTVTTAALKQIDITPMSPSVPIGTTLPLVAKGTYADGSVVDLTTSVTWSTIDPTIASISNASGSAGTAAGLLIGTTQVHADLGGVEGTTTLTVTSAKLVSIAVTPANSSLAAGLKQSMRAVGTYSDMSTVDLTGTAVWSTGDETIATVSNATGAQGQLTAVGAGTTSVTATASGIAGSTNVTVTSAALTQIVVSPINPTRLVGQRVQFTATAIFDNGTQRNVTGQATWSSSNTSVATTNNTGSATGVASGTTTIQATYNGLSSSTVLTVSAAQVVSITVTPIAPSLAAGTAQNFQAVAIYSDNTSQDVTGQATWVSTAPAVASVTTNGFGRGRVTALMVGTADIQATYQGVTGSTTVTVTAATLVSISVTPASVSVPVGTVRQYSAAGIYSDGSSRDVTAQATWQSSAADVAAVTTGGRGGPGGPGGGARGQVTAIAAGNATIQATFSGISGTAAITVTAAKLVSIQLSPAAPTVAKGVPVRFTATALFDDNSSQDVTAAATWVSSAPMVAQVSDSGGSKGLATALAAGTATISATWKGSQGSTTLTVTGATLMTIQVTPFTPKLPVGFVSQFMATGIFSDNTTQDLTPLATWSSDSPQVAQASDSGATKGRVTPLAAGSAKISASYQGVTGTDVVTVSNATLTGLTVTPNDSTVAVQSAGQLTATGAFSDGSSMDVTDYVTWLSSAPQIADVSNANGSQGQAKGLASGDATITAVRGMISATATIHVGVTPAQDAGP